VALGSNLGPSQQQILSAIDALADLQSTRIAGRSRLYRTAPWGVLEQPDFVNAVVKLETSLSAHDLLDALLAIERLAGRERNGERWGPRTLDLDLLHMAGVALADPRLTLPHPRLAVRAFVLLPLAELAPELWIPGVGRVDELLAQCDRTGCAPLN
jgi:2-amino-4-hydroxy-6-hydroxymethyldihydropteridine diphosphokinase